VALVQTHAVAVKVTIFLRLLSKANIFFFAIFFYDASFWRNEVGQKAGRNFANIHRSLYMYVYLDLCTNLIFYKLYISVNKFQLTEAGKLAVMIFGVILSSS
jgi:hypothetical protein